MPLPGNNVEPGDIFNGLFVPEMCFYRWETKQREVSRRKRAGGGTRLSKGGTGDEEPSGVGGVVSGTYQRISRYEVTEAKCVRNHVRSANDGEAKMRNPFAVAGQTGH